MIPILKRAHGHPKIIFSDQIHGKSNMLPIKIIFICFECPLGSPPQKFLLVSAAPWSIETLGEAILNLSGQIDLAITLETSPYLFNITHRAIVKKTIKSNKNKFIIHQPPNSKYNDKNITMPLLTRITRKCKKYQ